MYQFFTDLYIFESAVENFVYCLLWDILEWGFQCTFIFLQYGIKLPEYHLVFIFAERNDSSLVNT